MEAGASDYGIGHSNLSDRISQDVVRAKLRVHHGVLVQKPKPTWRHGRAQGRIYSLIDSRFNDFLVGTEVTVQVSEKKSLVPDLAVQHASMVQEPYPTKPIVLCIEILSPDDSLNDTLSKCDTYHRWGTLENGSLILSPSAPGSTQKVRLFRKSNRAASCARLPFSFQ